MMKKVFFLFACCVLGSYISLAAEIGTGEETKVAEILALLETQQQQDPQTIDRYLEAVNTINKNYEEQLTVALTNNTHSGNTEKLLRDWETIRNFSHHLYTLKERSVQKEIPTSGGTYTFKSWVLMPWVNISRGNKNYFVFPAKKSFIQLNGSIVISGALTNSVTAEYQGNSYLPEYYYAGGNSLINLHSIKTGERITYSKGKEQPLYLFFDLPEEKEHSLKQLSFQMSGTTISGSELFLQPAFSAFYTTKEQSKGFKHCKAVATWKGNTTMPKEYAEQECEDAANLKWYTGMHEDLIGYAKDHFLQ